MQRSHLEPLGWNSGNTSQLLDDSLSSSAHPSSPTSSAAPLSSNSSLVNSQQRVLNQYFNGRVEFLQRVERLSELWVVLEQEDVLSQLEMTTPQQFEQYFKDLDWQAQQRSTRVEALRDAVLQVSGQVRECAARLASLSFLIFFFHHQRTTWANAALAWMQSHSSVMDRVLQLDIGYSETALQVCRD